MTITEKISIDYNEWGCPILEKNSKGYLSFTSDNANNITIKGNEEGLKLLAKSIIGLINSPQSNNGFHIHLDEIYDINKENKSFIIDLISKNTE